MSKTTSPDAGTDGETVTSADGTEIAFERTGSGPPLVLVPGGAIDRSGWWELADVRPTLAEHCTVYAIDRRGRGESGDADEYGLEREAEDVAAVAGSVDDPATVFGHSFGGLCALEASLRTDNLRGLILYEPGGNLILHEPGVAVGNEPDFEEMFNEIEPLLADGENEQALLSLMDAVEFPSAHVDAARSAPHWQGKVDAAHTMLREGQALLEYEFDAERFAAMTTPTLLLAGGESPQWFKDGTEALEDALPNGRIATIDGAKHFAMVSEPDRFVDEVLAFVQDSS